MTQPDRGDPGMSSRSTGLGKARIDALSDGIFAVALTILVLELRAPDLAAPNWWDELWPKVLAFLASFFIGAIYWVAHNNESRLIEHTNRPLLWLNLLFLLSIVFIPFSTAFLGRYSTQDAMPDHARLAIVVYGANLIAAGLLLQAIWMYARARELLVSWLKDSKQKYQVGRTSFRNMFIPTLAAIALVVSFGSIGTSYIILLLAPLGYVAMTLLQRPPRAATE